MNRCEKNMFAFGLVFITLKKKTSWVASSFLIPPTKGQTHTRQPAAEVQNLNHCTPVKPKGRCLFLQVTWHWPQILVNPETSSDCSFYCNDQSTKV